MKTSDHFTISLTCRVVIYNLSVNVKFIESPSTIGKLIWLFRGGGKKKVELTIYRRDLFAALAGEGDSGSASVLFQEQFFFFFSIDYIKPNWPRSFLKNWLMPFWLYDRNSHVWIVILIQYDFWFWFWFFALTSCEKVRN